MSEYQTREERRTGEDTTIEIPRLYQVLIHNDHYTTMEFVVFILKRIFDKPHDEAVRIMLKVHKEGIGVAGIYVKSVAEAKVNMVHQLARSNGFPLRCSICPE